MKTTAIIASLLGVAGISTAMEPVEWAVEDGGNGHWYEAVVVDDPIGWNDANAAAESAGGYLATLTSQGEHDMVVERFVASMTDGWEFWLGGYQDLNAPDYSEPGGGWGWVTGESWSFTAWNPTQPDNAIQEDYLHFQSQLWNDAQESGVYNTDTIRSYIVEWDHDPSIIQWRIGDGGNGHWYKMTEYGLYDTWESAQDDAVLRGGYLATITSASESEFVESLYGLIGDSGSCDTCTSGTAAVIGAKLDSQGQWQWVTNETWSYENWYPGEPSGDTESVLYLRCPGQWNDGTDSLDDPCRYLAIIEYTVLPGSALGACCLDGLCITTAAADCAGHGGSWGGPDSSCADFDCPNSCPGDTNDDGQIDINDLLVVIEGWGFCP